MRANVRERERYQKRVGTVVEGKWRLDELLGWGSTSAVYAATHRNGHRAALKILHKALCADVSAAERFLREARIVNTIKHRAVVPVNDDGVTEDGCAYLILDLLDGETLEEKRERAGGRIAIEDLAPIAEELMSAIAAVHAAGVIHRDLKPQNVFLTATQLKLLDFGTARITDPDRSDASQPVTVTGMVIGTPSFMSPEQARGARDEIDVQSDVWSLGALLFTMLSGELVHPGKDRQTRLLAAATEKPRSLADALPDLDDAVVAVIDRALGFEKKDRWPDVQAMRVAFRSAVVVSSPTLPQLEAEREIPAPDGEEPGALATSDSTPGSAAPEDTAAAPALPETREEAAGREETAGREDIESDAPSSASTHPELAPPRRRGVPLALAASGVALVAALAMVFAATRDEGAKTPTASTAHVAPAASPSPAGPSGSAAAPAASFIVISAPEDPAAPAAAPAKSAPPAWAVSAWEKAQAEKAEKAKAEKAAQAAKTEKADAAAPSDTASTTNGPPSSATASGGGGGGIVRSMDEEAP